MDIKKLATILISLGIVIILIAVGWWANFYGGLVDEVKGDLGDAVRCLYSSGGICGLVKGVAAFAGETPYNPIIFWVGISLAAVGIILRVSAK